MTICMLQAILGFEGLASVIRHDNGGILDVWVRTSLELHRLREMVQMTSVSTVFLNCGDGHLHHLARKLRRSKNPAILVGSLHLYNFIIAEHPTALVDLNEKKAMIDLKRADDGHAMRPEDL